LEPITNECAYSSASATEYNQHGLLSWLTDKRYAARSAHALAHWTHQLSASAHLAELLYKAWTDGHHNVASIETIATQLSTTSSLNAMAIKPTILLVPGACTGPEVFDPVVSVFCAAGYEALAVAQASANPTDPDAYTA